MNTPARKTNLFARWVLFNTLVAALVVVGYANGVLEHLLVDKTYMTHGIMLFTAVVVVASGWTTYQISGIWKVRDGLREGYQKAIKLGPTQSDDFKNELIESANSVLAPYNLAGTILVSLGLIGTVIGISLAFTGISPDVISNAEASQAVMATLLSGLATAFHTTLVGIVGMVWNLVNQYMMKQEVSRILRSTFGAGS